MSARATALSALAALAALGPLGGCALPDDPAPTLDDLRFTEPADAVELVPVPGNTLRFAWSNDEADAADLQISIGAVPTAGDPVSYWLAQGAYPDGAASYQVVAPPLWVIPVAAPPPAGVYRLHATAWYGGDVVADAWATGLLVVQGASFRERELTFTADESDRDIWLTTVTATVARAVVFLADTPDGPRQVLSDATIASDLAPVGRVITFTGRTIDDVAIPAGTYQAFIEVRAHDGAQRYVMGGLTIHWQP